MDLRQKQSKEGPNFVSGDGGQLSCFGFNKWWEGPVRGPRTGPLRDGRSEVL